MSDLVSVGGICFVAEIPEPSKQADIPQDTRPKRKYRPRGERTRKEQQREAQARYYREHRNEILQRQKIYRAGRRQQHLEYGRKYYAEHKQELTARRKEYYQANREKFARKAHEYYLRRKSAQLTDAPTETEKEQQ